MSFQMVKRYLYFVLCFFYICNIYSQRDTIYTNDTTIVSVRIINQTDDNLMYSYIKDGIKNIKTLPLEVVRKISFENIKIEVFCDLMATKKFLSNDVDIKINYGNRDSLWLDKKIYTLLSSDLQNYNTTLDALNYMGNEGWETISSYSSSYNSYIVEHYILKKLITK